MSNFNMQFQAFLVFRLIFALTKSIYVEAETAILEDSFLDTPALTGSGDIRWSDHDGMKQTYAIYVQQHPVYDTRVYKIEQEPVVSPGGDWKLIDAENRQAGEISYFLAYNQTRGSEGYKAVYVCEVMYKLGRREDDDKTFTLDIASANTCEHIEESIVTPNEREYRIQAIREKLTFYTEAVASTGSEHLLFYICSNFDSTLTLYGTTGTGSGCQSGGDITRNITVNVVIGDVLCPPTEVGRNAKVDNVTIHHGVRQNDVIYSCERGFQFDSGHVTTTVACQLNGAWSSDFADCRAIKCENPPLVHNARISWEKKINTTMANHTLGSPFSDSNSSINPYSFGDSVFYKCDTGYKGDSVITCNHGGWGMIPVCEVISCPLPPSVQNGKYTGDDFTFNHTIVYECDPGYNLTGSNTLSCQEDGWYSQPPVCQAKDCKHPGEFVNGVVKGDSFTFNQVIEFECDEGFNMIGDNTSLCTESGQWNSEVPVCEQVEPVCPPVKNINNGGMTYGNVSIGSQVTFHCKLGYNLIGSPTASCKLSEDGWHARWSSNPPICQIVKCRKPKPIANGEVISQGNGYTYSQKVAIKCNEGFTAVGRHYRTICTEYGEWDRVLACRLIKGDEKVGEIKTKTKQSSQIKLLPVMAMVLGAIAILGAILLGVAVYRTYYRKSPNTTEAVPVQLLNFADRWRLSESD